MHGQTVKHWLQTWLVHMRRPVQLWGELGWSGFLSLQLIAAGSVLAALLHPLFLGMMVWQLLGGALLATSDAADAEFRRWLALIVLLGGYAGSICLGWVGLRRRGLVHLGRSLTLVPLYWLLLSVAAARAIYQLVRAPHEWEKTPHGLGRSSLRNAERNANNRGSAARDFNSLVAARHRRRR